MNYVFKILQYLSNLRKWNTSNIKCSFITILFSPLGCFQSPWWCISMVWRRENDQGNYISYYSQQISPEYSIKDCLNIFIIYISNFYLQYEMVMQMADAFSMSKSNIVPIKEPSGGWY